MCVCLYLECIYVCECMCVCLYVCFGVFPTSWSAYMRVWVWVCMCVYLSVSLPESSMEPFPEKLQ